MRAAQELMRSCGAGDGRPGKASFTATGSRLAPPSLQRSCTLFISLIRRALVCTFQWQMVAQTAGHLEKDTNKHISKLTFSALPAAETTCNSKSLSVMLMLGANVEHSIMARCAFTELQADGVGCLELCVLVYITHTQKNSSSGLNK